MVVVLLAGNDGDSKSAKKVDKDGLVRLSYPAAIPGVIGVAALKRDGKPAKFSDRNSSVLVAAPGAGVIGAGPSGTYWDGEGTSQAGAHRVGRGALIRAKYHDMAPALVAQAITGSADHRPKPRARTKRSASVRSTPPPRWPRRAGSGYKAVAGGRTGRFDEGRSSRSRSNAIPRGWSSSAAGSASPRCSASPGR